MSTLQTFRVGSFYGVTAPQLVLTDKATINKILRVIQNTTSVDVLTDLEVELIALEKIITQAQESNGIVEFTKAMDTGVLLNVVMHQLPQVWELWGSPQTENEVVRKHASYTRQVRSAIKSFEETGVFPEKLVKLGIADIQSAYEWQHLLAQLYEGTQSLDNKVRVLNEDGILHEVKLSDEALSILKDLIATATSEDKRTGLTKIRWILDAIQKTQKTRVTGMQKYFNLELTHLKNLTSVNQYYTINNNYLESTDLTSKGKTTVTRMLQKFKTDAETIVNHAEGAVDEDYKADQFISKIEEFLNLEPALREELIEDIFPGEYLLVQKLIKELGINYEWFTHKSLEAIIIFNTMHNIFKNQTLNKMLPEKQDVKEVQSILNELAEAGVIGLTVYGEQMMIRELRKTPLAKEPKTKEKISTDTELYNNSKILLADAKSKEFLFEYVEQGGYVLE